MKKVILFDMDGVLIDSRPAMELAWEHSTKIIGLKIPFNSYFKLIGMPFSNIANELGIKSNLINDLKKEYGIATANHIDKIKPYKGINYLLRKLRKNNLILGIVTSKEFWRADFLVDYFGIYSDILITPEYTAQGKPSGEPLRKALEILCIKSKDALYIGDMATDFESAKDANIDYLHAAWGYGSIPNRVITASYPEEVLEFTGLSVSNSN